MNSGFLFRYPPLVIFFITILVFVQIPVFLCYDLYASCNNKYHCGDIANVDYPFWGGDRVRGCGKPDLFLNCTGDITLIEMRNVTYRVLSVNMAARSLKIAREDYYSGGICSPKFVNTTLDSNFFVDSSGYANITLVYGCPPSTMPELFGCLEIDIPEINGMCKGPSFLVPVPGTHIMNGDIWNVSKMEEVLREGFEVNWKEGKSCGNDADTNQTTCFSAPPTEAPQKPQDNGNKTELKLGLYISGAAIAGILLGVWVFSTIQRRKRRAQESKSKDLPTPPPSTVPASSINFSRSIPSYPYSRSDLEKGSTYFGAQIFSYDELEEATNNFDTSRELGDGGFGTVYYGKLHDGRIVAVKRLYENNLKRVEQFMNEVEILTKIRHKNLVTLYGCTSKRSRELLLVYEYIPNGTVADHLHGNRSKSGLLTWPVRLSIAIESAEALAYLHLSDVIHRDVKTNNILLDEKFQVKVADFGLSRLFPTDVTHVSTAPQGTPGYVDPEYYQCYQLTDKSDVYSFGVVLIELISSLPAVDTNRHRHDINLANMAVNKIQNHALHELVDPLIGFEKDYTVKRMTTSVAELAFRCLQQERDMRPSMDEVLEILRGIQNEEIGAQKAEVVDIRAADDVGLLKNIPPPLSPDSVVNDKWQMQDFRRTA